VSSTLTDVAEAFNLNDAGDDVRARARRNGDGNGRVPAAEGRAGVRCSGS
jgi:hypothetical protein